MHVSNGEGAVCLSTGTAQQEEEKEVAAALGAAGLEEAGRTLRVGWVEAALRKWEKSNREGGLREQVCTKSVLRPHRDWVGDNLTHRSFHGGLLEGTGGFLLF